MVRILYQNPHGNADSDNFYISIPKDWSGGADDEVTVIVDDVCVVIPQTIAGATGELIVLRLLEAMIEGDVIDAGDVQKAIEHILWKMKNPFLYALEKKLLQNAFSSR